MDSTQINTEFIHYDTIALNYTELTNIAVSFFRRGKVCVPLAVPEGSLSEQYELKQVALTLYGCLIENLDSHKRDKAPK